MKTAMKRAMKRAHATVQTKSGNFVIIDKNEMPITRPYLNFCTLEYREQRKNFCSSSEALKEFYKKNYEEGMFQGYDRGHDLSLSDPIAIQIMNSGVLNS